MSRKQEEGEQSMKYSVIGSGGPGFASPEEAFRVLEEIILSSFDKLIGLEKKKKILAGCSRIQSC